MIQIEPTVTQVSSEIPMTYYHLNAGEGKPLLLFFHGYSDAAQAFLKRAFPSLNQRYEILAVNGLFPVPQKKDNVWKQAFAWYFADFSSNSVLIHPQVSAKAVTHLIEKLDLAERPKILIGFSQGGFFLPFIFPKLKNVKHLIAIGAAYREQDYDTKLSVPLDALHGDQDEIIPIELAEKSFKALSKNINPHGKFHQFAGLGHTMNDEARAWLKTRIEEIL
ncbi:MAG: hypothetical protein H7061_02975 [Bdellovibrionaceae bacterium]|nr:hypothetical protein [Bdellovibrio sp.]